MHSFRIISNDKPSKRSPTKPSFLKSTSRLSKLVKMSRFIVYNHPLSTCYSQSQKQTRQLSSKTSNFPIVLPDATCNWHLGNDADSRRLRKAKPGTKRERWFLPRPDLNYSPLLPNWRKFILFVGMWTTPFNLYSISRGCFERCEDSIGLSNWRCPSFVEWAPALPAGQPTLRLQCCHTPVPGHL